MPTIATFGDVTYEDPRSLVPVDWNTQERTRAELDRIKDSIKVHGVVGPLAARPSDRSIAGGHGRLDAILELLDEGWKLDRGGIPVVWKECDDAELMALNMALNNATGQPNFQKVAVAIRRIEELGRVDLLTGGGTGFAARQIADIQTLALQPASTPERDQREAQKRLEQRDEDGNANYDDYDEHLADQLAAPEADPYEWSELTFSVAEDQRETIDGALALARESGGLQTDAQALHAICAEYVSNHG
jgi:ParB-like chromosome segregation protein Spo0J